jgi:hypothetical protein
MSTVSARRRARGALYWCATCVWLLALSIPGCSNLDRQAGSGAHVVLPQPVPIPAGSAHASFQGGRQVSGTNRLDPYCELEIETVAEQPQQARPGRYRVLGERLTLLRDPTTRIPALLTAIGCSDPLFQESFWRLGAESGGNLHSLRCIRPFYHCVFVPPLRLEEVGAVTGPAIRVEGPGD